VAQLEITLVRSGIGSSKRHKAVLVGLGLRRLHKTVVREDRPEVRGMLYKVRQWGQPNAVKSLDGGVDRVMGRLLVVEEKGRRHVLGPAFPHGSRAGRCH
jgi:large subunit ribosomal protein L30